MRHLHPRTPKPRLPAAGDDAAPGQHSAADLRLPWLPSAGRTVRSRSHHPIRSGRSYLPVQFVAFVPSSPPGETSTRLVACPTSARHPGLDRAPRPDLHHRTRQIPDLVSSSRPGRLADGRHAERANRVPHSRRSAAARIRARAVPGTRTRESRRAGGRSASLPGA
jgi:hypothetical protein